MNRSTKVLSASENLRVPLNRGNALLVEVVGTGTGSVDLKSAVDGANWTNHPYIQPRAAAPTRSVSQITSMTRTLYAMLPPLTDVRIDVVVTTGTVTITYREIEYAGLASAGTTGDVAGPASSTDNAVARFDGTGGKTLQNSGVIVDDSNNVTGIAAASATTIELGHASDTTLSRSAAGVLAVEGVTVASNATTATHTAQQIELGHATDTTLSRSSAGVMAVEGVAVPTISSTSTLTNKRIDPRSNTVASSATPSINTDTTDIFTITALAEAITSMSSGLSGTPVNGQKLTIRFKDDGTGRAITWGASWTAVVSLPTTTVASKLLYVGAIYNSTSSKWDVVATAQEA